MAPQTPAPHRDATKMQQLPKNVKINKRPLLNPAKPSPYAGQQAQKVVYFGSRTPFMSAFKRVKKLLELADKREMQSILSKVKSKQVAMPEDSRSTEAISIKASGKAIERALALALFIQDQGNYSVVIKTGSANAIDDITYGETDDGQQLQGEHVASVDDLPDSRIRSTSTVEIAVSLK